MNLLLGFFNKVTGVYNWMFKETDATVRFNRKRKLTEINENTSPKRFKSLLQSLESKPDLIKGSDSCLQEGSEKLKAMNDVQFIGEETRKPQRNPLSECPAKNNIPVINIPDDDDNYDDDVQLVDVKPKEPLEIGYDVSFKSTKRTPGSLYSKKLVRQINTSPKRNLFSRKSWIKDKPRSLSMSISNYSKEQYNDLLKTILNGGSLGESPSFFKHFSSNNNKVPLPSTIMKSKVEIHKKPEIEVIDMTKPKEKRNSVFLPVHSSQSNSEDADSDVELVSIEPVSRVNSFEKNVQNCKFAFPEWLQSLQTSWEDFNEQTNRQTKELQLKKSLYAKRNKCNMDAIEERLRRHMTISDTVVIQELPEDEEPQLPKLTTKMEERIKSALNPRPPNDVVAEGFGLRISRKDMHTLAGLNWLNDEVINYYMNLLIERGKSEKMPKVYAFNTFFYPTLIGRGYSMLRRWTRKVDIFAQDLIVVPVHLGVHWCVAIVDFRSKIIEYYDSMGHSNNRCLNALLNYLQDESMDKKKVSYDTSSWTLKNMTDIPQQMNGSDCGMFACTFAEYKCRNAKITFTQNDMPYFRRKMVYEILTRRLLIDCQL